MKNRTYVFLCIVFIFHSSSWAQLPLSILWEKSLGGSNNDEAYDIQNTNDGGYIVAGITHSIDGDVTVQKGYGDYWLVKLDSFGEIQWQKSYGGSGEDIAKSVQQTRDSGYIICGWSASFDQDISNHIGLWDIWVVKTDENGNIQWEKSLGGTDWEFSWSIQQTYDDGFIITGWSWSDDGDITVHYGSWLLSDIWIVKLNSSGNLEWQKTLGGSDTDRALEVVQTSDSGYAVAGCSASDDIDVSGHHGSSSTFDYWIVKLNGSGDIQWQNSYGGTGDDYTQSIQQTTDKGFIVGGQSRSADGDITNHHGGADSSDFWILKLDSLGNIQWQNSLGGTLYDGAWSAIQTTNGYAVAGHTTSNDGDVQGWHGFGDYWVATLDYAGNLLHQKCLGGTNDEIPYAICQSSDGNLVVAGDSKSVDGDVTEHHNTNVYSDYWIVKLTGEDPSIVITPSVTHISIFPNPVQDFLIIKSTTPNKVSIQVSDLQGRQINFFNTGDHPNNNIQINTKNLFPGFYTVKLIYENTGFCEVGKFLKQ